MSNITFDIHCIQLDPQAGYCEPMSFGGGGSGGGATGPTGAAGIPGGPTGPTGPQGPAGGPTGPTGPNPVACALFPLDASGSIGAMSGCVEMTPATFCGAVHQYDISSGWGIFRSPGITEVTVGIAGSNALYPDVASAIADGCPFVRVVSTFSEPAALIIPPGSSALIYIDPGITYTLPGATLTGGGILTTLSFMGVTSGAATLSLTGAFITDASSNLTFDPMTVQKSVAGDIVTGLLGGFRAYNVRFVYNDLSSGFLNFSTANTDIHINDCTVVGSNVTHFLFITTTVPLKINNLSLQGTFAAASDLLRLNNDNVVINGLQWIGVQTNIQITGRGTWNNFYPSLVGGSAISSTIIPNGPIKMSNFRIGAFSILVVNIPTITSTMCNNGQIIGTWSHEGSLISIPYTNVNMSQVTIGVFSFQFILLTFRPLQNSKFTDCTFTVVTGPAFRAFQNLDFENCMFGSTLAFTYLLAGDQAQNINMSNCSITGNLTFNSGVFINLTNMRITGLFTAAICQNFTINGMFVAGAFTTIGGIAGVPIGVIDRSGFVVSNLTSTGALSLGSHHDAVSQYSNIQTSSTVTLPISRYGNLTNCRCTTFTASATANSWTITNLECESIIILSIDHCLSNCTSRAGITLGVSGTSGRGGNNLNGCKIGSNTQLTIFNDSNIVNGGISTGDNLGGISGDKGSLIVHGSNNQISNLAIIGSRQATNQRFEVFGSFNRFNNIQLGVANTQALVSTTAPNLLTFATGTLTYLVPAGGPQGNVFFVGQKVSVSNNINVANNRVFTVTVVTTVGANTQLTVAEAVATTAASGQISFIDVVNAIDTTVLVYFPFGSPTGDNTIIFAGQFNEYNNMLIIPRRGWFTTSAIMPFVDTSRETITSFRGSGHKFTNCHFYHDHVHYNILNMGLFINYPANNTVTPPVGTTFFDVQCEQTHFDNCNFGPSCDPSTITFVDTSVNVAPYQNITMTTAALENTYHQCQFFGNVTNNASRCIFNECRELIGGVGPFPATTGHQITTTATALNNIFVGCMCGRVTGGTSTINANVAAPAIVDLCTTEAIPTNFVAVNTLF